MQASADGWLNLEITGGINYDGGGGGAALLMKARRRTRRPPTTDQLATTLQGAGRVAEGQRGVLPGCDGRPPGRASRRVGPRRERRRGWEAGSGGEEQDIECSPMTTACTEGVAPVRMYNRAPHIYLKENL